MTETKQSSRSERKTGPKAAAAAGKESADAGLRGRVDQMGALLSKGLDLAEAGLGLGATLVSRVGEVAQHQILERFMTQMGPAAQAAGAAPPEPEAAPQAEPEPQNYGITNRLPLQPGGQVRISFSINNDSMEAAKKVALSLEGFVGAAHGRKLDAAGFALKPARKTIAPMDFDKFVLEGALPPKALPDIYHGWVIVSSDTELRIPVQLVVSSL